MTICPIFALLYTTLVHLVAANPEDPRTWTCANCVHYVEHVIQGGNPPEYVCGEKLEGCPSVLPLIDTLKNLTQSQVKPFDACKATKQCKQHEWWEDKVISPTFLDVRVAPGLGSRGYGQVRVSVIDFANNTRSQQFIDFFSYSEVFQYRWPQYKLYTTVVSVTPGTPTTIVFDQNNQVVISLAPKYSGVRGIFISDPCITNKFVPCEFLETLQLATRIPQLLNTAVGYGDIAFWGILGDNFYDLDGSISPMLFQELNPAVLALPFVTTVGNHDLWFYGSPTVHMKWQQQYGWGFLQFYGQDVMAGKSNASQPYDFSNNPNTQKSNNYYYYMPTANNFFFYTMIGNIAMIGFSGAHTKDDQIGFLQEACTWIQGEQPDWILVLGHWSAVDYGCEYGMDVQGFYNLTITVDGCSQMAKNTKYFEGHNHCNQVVQTNTGFQVAGYGMEGCDNFGLPYIDSTGGSLEVLYYAIDHQGGVTAGIYDALISCIQQNGLAGCKQYATTWLNQPL